MGPDGAFTFEFPNSTVVLRDIIMVIEKAVGRVPELYEVQTDIPC